MAPKKELLSIEAEVITLSCPEKHAVDAGVFVAARAVLSHVHVSRESVQETDFEEAVKKGMGEAEGEEVAGVGDLAGNHEEELGG